MKKIVKQSCQDGLGSKNGHLMSKFECVGDHGTNFVKTLTSPILQCVMLNLQDLEAILILNDTYRR